MANECHIKFFDSNLISNASWYSFSSESSSYPFTNALDDRRSRIWRPTGNFTIDDTNNKLYIKDGTGYVTVTLTNADYATPALMASHIQTKLNAASSSWVCTHSTTTNKFTISRSSGSAELILSTTTNAVWDTLGYIGTTDRTTSPFVADEQRNHTSEYIKADLGVTTGVDFGSIIAPIDGAFAVSQSATVTLSGNNVDLWDSPPFSQTMSVDEFGAFANIYSTEYYRYWLIEIVDRTNPDGPEAYSFGNVFIGAATQITSSNIAQGFSRAQIDKSKKFVSESGVKYFDNRPKFETFKSMSIQVMDDDDRIKIKQLYDSLGAVTPFYVSFDPTMFFSSSESEYSRYVYFTREPSINHVIRDRYTVGLEFDEAI